MKTNSNTFNGYEFSDGSLAASDHEGYSLYNSHAESAKEPFTSSDEKTFHFTQNIRIQSINIVFRSDDTMRCQDYTVKTIGFLKECGFSIIECGTSITDKKTHYFTFRKQFRSGDIIKLIVFSRFHKAENIQHGITDSKKDTKFLIYVNDSECKNYREILIRIRRLTNVSE